MGYLVYVVAAMLMWGLWGFLPRIAVSRLDSTSAQLFTWLGGSLLAVPCVLIFREKMTGILEGPAKETAFNHYLPYACAVGAGLCSMVGGFMYNKALSLSGGNTATVIGISALYPMVSILLTVIFLKQRMNAGQIAGVVLCISGAVLLAYSSSSPKPEPVPEVKPVEAPVETAV